MLCPPRAKNVIFTRIGFAIKKKLAAQLVGRLPLIHKIINYTLMENNSNNKFYFLVGQQILFFNQDVLD
jgi:hypothetical protein